MSASFSLFPCRQSSDILLADNVGEDPQPLGTSNLRNYSLRILVELEGASGDLRQARRGPHSISTAQNQ